MLSESLLQFKCNTQLLSPQLMHAKPILFSGMSEHNSETTVLDESHPAAEEVQSDSEVIR